jgi:predicted phosphodiesterase
MRTIVLSDLHIGDPRYADNRAVQDLLVSEKYDRLIINGDFLDLWLSDINNIAKDPLFQLLEKLSHIKEIIWVIGNHDMDITKSGYNSVMHNIAKVDSFEMIDNNKKILFVHGHQAYKNGNCSWTDKKVAKIHMFLCKSLGIDLQRIINRTCWYKKYIQNKRKKILNRYSKDAEIIVIGHTHNIGYYSNGVTELFDLGSAIKTRSYAIIENGVIWIKLEKK